MGPGGSGAGRAAEPENQGGDELEREALPAEPFAFRRAREAIGIEKLTDNERGLLAGKTGPTCPDCR